MGPAERNLRAGASIALLLGFHLLVAVLVIVPALGLVAVAVFLPLPTELPVGARLGAKSAFLTGLLVAYGGFAVTILRVFSAVSRSQRLDVWGVPLNEEQAPALWALVRDVAARAGTRPPDHLRVIPAVNAGVAEDARMLGLRGGRRYLFIGAPLLVGLTVDQLRACLAHEMAHYSGRDTRLGPVTYRGREALIRTLQRVAPASISGVIIGHYAYLYFRVESALGRSQEYAADRISAQLAGVQNAAGCLRQVWALAEAWRFLCEQQLGPGIRAGLMPADVFGGFGTMLNHRAGELARLRAGVPVEQRSPWDSHPPMAARLSALAAMGERDDAQSGRDLRAAASLLIRPQECFAAAQALLVDAPHLVKVDWPQLAATAASARAEQKADQLYRAAAAVLGKPEGTLEDVLGLLQEDRLSQLAGIPAVTWAESAERSQAIQWAAAHLADAMRTEAVRSGVGRWSPAWPEPATLRGPAGQEVAFGHLAEQALRDPGAVAGVRGHLRALGLKLDAIPAAAAPRPGQALEVVAAVANLRVGWWFHDAVLTEQGMVLIPVSVLGRLEDGLRRVQARIRAQAVPQMLKLPRHRFLAFADIAAVRIDQRSRVYKIAQRDGGRLTVRLSQDSRYLGDGRGFLHRKLSECAGSAGVETPGSPAPA